MVKPEIDYLDENDYTKFISACKDKGEIAECFIIILHTGLRAEELCGLKWKNINFEDNTIQTKNSFQENPIYDKEMNIIGYARNKEPLKTKYSKRIIPMIKEVRILLLERRKKYNLTFSTTVNFYVHVTSNKKKKSINKLNTYLNEFKFDNINNNFENNISDNTNIYNNTNLQNLINKRATELLQEMLKESINKIS